MTHRKSEALYLAIARILAPRGVKGEVRARILTDFPERFAGLSTVYVGESLKAMRILSARVHRNLVFLKFEGYDTVEAAEKLRGQFVRVPASEAYPLPEDHYYWHQVLDLEVWTTGGEYLGRIVDILERPANDVYVVQGDRGEILVPAIEDVVKSIDLKEGKMIIEPIPGLLD